MKKTKLPMTLFVLLILATHLLFPSAVFASGSGEKFEAEVNGYHVSLSFMNEIKIGENQVHVQIVDPQDQSVTLTEVGISAMPMEANGHEPTESHGAPASELAGEHGSNSASGHAELASGHENMPGMGAESESVPESNHNIEADSHGESVTFMLEPEPNSGEFKGILDFEQSGEWELVVHFVAGEELLEVEFPLNVAGTTSKYTILAGIFGLNIVIISTAAFFKQKAGKKSL